MKLWIDDERPAPSGYMWCKSVNEAIRIIQFTDRVLCPYEIELIDTDHGAGDYALYGGDYIKLLDWLEETSRNYPIHIHSQNVVDVENIRAIIQKNGWREV